MSPSPMSDPRQDAPLRLDEAAKLAFPGGGMTASGLRREREVLSELGQATRAPAGLGRGIRP